MSYNRQLSPGAKRIVNQGRASDNLTDPYRYERHNSYTSPRTSTTSTTNTASTTGGVIPISTQTFVNYPPPNPTTTTTRPEQRIDPYSGRPIDAYTGRPRRSSLVDPLRGSNSTTTIPTRSRPNVIQTDFGRPSSPQKGSGRDKDSYVTPASSKEPRKVEHKKLYSVDNGTASLVADVDMPVSGERHHRRRESDGGERGAYRGLDLDRDKDRGRRRYHPNGERIKERTVEDEGAYSYTDAAGMFRETEPRWREREARPRRGSVDRGGASRERPVSMLDPNNDPRRSNKDIGPPPSTRGWARLNDGIGRAASLRDRSREVPQSPSRARVPQSPNRARAPTSPSRGRYGDSSGYSDPRDPYYVAPRTTSEDRRNDRQTYDQYEYEDRREPRHHHRRNSVTKADQGIKDRGFGIRLDSQDRYGRGSDESFERQEKKYRDSAYEPHRRDTAPEISYHEEQRLEQEKQERMRAADRYRSEDRDRPADRDHTRRREDDRSYNRDHERGRDQRRDHEYDVDRERERERERMMQPPSDHERHHHRRDSNVDYNNGGSRAQSDAVSGSGLTAAAGGLAGAATAYGIGKAINRSDDRDTERERERERDFERRPERPREHDQHRLSPRPVDPRPYETHSDEGIRYSQERDRERQPGSDKERSLGFAFEGGAPPEPSRSAPPNKDPAPARAEEREQERQHEGNSVSLPPAVDPDEDYRRRMEQVQRELGHAPEDRHSDSDPDRERRRREREQRQRDRHPNGEPSVAGTSITFDSTASSRMPGGYDDESTVDAYSTASSRPGLTRKPSILDAPMNDEPVQILDNSLSDRRENRVRIVDPPAAEETKKPKGILKQPTSKFPEHPDAMREGVAPLKDASKSGIPPGARWTKIDRRLVNPQALEEAQERYEERMDCVIVLRVLTKEEIQKMADRTKAIRDERHEEERATHRSSSKAHTNTHRNRDRRDRDEYLDDDSEDEFKPKAPKMLELPGAPPSSTTASGTNAGDSADFVRERDRSRGGERERDREYSMSGGLGRRGDDGY